jgi:hypothetical protein
MIMYSAFSQKFVLPLFLLTTFLQGWPPMAMGTCSMPESQIMSQVEDCCCHDTRQNPSPAAFSSCAPGKTLVVILATGSSLLPGKDKNGKALQQILTIAPFVNLSAPFISSLLLGFDAGELILSHATVTSLFLIDCTFRL